MPDSSRDLSCRAPQQVQDRKGKGDRLPSAAGRQRLQEQAEAVTDAHGQGDDDPGEPQYARQWHDVFPHFSTATAARSDCMAGFVGIRAYYSIGTRAMTSPKNQTVV